MREFFDKVKETNLDAENIQTVLQQFVYEEKIIEQTSKKDLAQIAIFLWQTKNFSALQFFLEKAFNKVTNMPSEILFHFIHYFKHQNPEIDLNVFTELDEHLNVFKVYNCPYKIKGEVFEEKQTEQIEVFEKRYSEIKEDLVDKLEFARSQRLDKEAKKTLDKLLEAFPNDPRFVTEQKRMFEHEAAKVIESHSKPLNSRKSSTIVLEPKKESTSPIYKLFLSSFKKENLIHLIELFILANENETVIEIFDAHPEIKKNNFWLYIEHLVKIERYLEALAELKKNQKDIRTSTEGVFTFYYYHAICLWYLNDKTTAFEIMKAIHKTRPYFRQTTFYINLWQHHEKVG